MSRRPRKSKQQIAAGVESVADQQTQSAVPVTTPTPVPEPSSGSTQVTEAVPVTPKEKKINPPAIAVSRVKNAINSGLLNASVSTLSKAIKAKMEGVDENAPQMTALRVQAGALSRSKVRFSSDCPKVLAAAATVLTRSLVHKAMQEAVSKKVKTTNIRHLYATDFLQYEYYALIQGLPAFEVERKNQELIKTQEDFNANLKTKAAFLEKEFKKKYSVKGVKNKNKVQTSAENGKKGKSKETSTGEQPADSSVPSQSTDPTNDADAEVDAETEDDSKDYPFFYYVGSICEDLKREGAFLDRRTARVFRTHVSQIVLQFVQRTVQWANAITCCMDNKTISGKTIYEVIKMKLLENESYTEDITFETVVIPATKTAPEVQVYEAQRKPVYTTDVHVKYFALIEETLEKHYSKPEILEKKENTSEEATV